MIRLATGIALASAVSLGLMANIASACPVHHAPATLGTASHYGNGFLSVQDPAITGGQYDRNSRIVPRPVPDISGLYFIAGRLCEVRQWGGRLLFINEWGSVSEGIFLSPTVVQALDWEHGRGLTGVLNRNRIEWANGTVWFKR